MCAKRESCTTNAERNGGLQNKDKIVDKFTWETEQGVIDAAKPTGCDTASRYWVDIDLSVVEAGEHTVTVVYKNTAGSMVSLNDFKLIKLP